MSAKRKAKKAVKAVPTTKDECTELLNAFVRECEAKTICKLELDVMMLKPGSMVRPVTQSGLNRMEEVMTRYNGFDRKQGMVVYSSPELTNAFRHIAKHDGIPDPLSGIPFVKLEDMTKYEESKHAYQELIKAVQPIISICDGAHRTVTMQRHVKQFQEEKQEAPRMWRKGVVYVMDPKEVNMIKLARVRNLLSHGHVASNVVGDIMYLQQLYKQARATNKPFNKIDVVRLYQIELGHSTKKTAQKVKGNVVSRTSGQVRACATTLE